MLRATTAGIEATRAIADKLTSATCAALPRAVRRALHGVAALRRIARIAAQHASILKDTRRAAVPNAVRDRSQCWASNHCKTQSLVRQKKKSRQPSRTSASRQSCRTPSAAGVAEDSCRAARHTIASVADQPNSGECRRLRGVERAVCGILQRRAHANRCNASGKPADAHQQSGGEKHTLGSKQF